ncbi:MAG TPA: hypothetical protein PKB09_02735 [Candidatus Saccharibacteria bacterium]|nr:hypothetical protein [Candidatus Saccharibacteria bacterium]
MKKVLFIHRSVGNNLINDSDLYKLIDEEGLSIEFSDYNQNTDMLRSNSLREKMGFSFPGNDTNPADYAKLFSEKGIHDYKKILEKTLRYDTIIIKSCYPNSNIKSNAELEEIKSYYLSIAKFFSNYPEKKLIMFTSPPLAPLMTNFKAAQRAKVLAKWLSSTNLGKNIYVFDFYSQLANQKGVLDKKYRKLLPFNSHPNKQAAKNIAPKIIKLIEELC